MATAASQQFAEKLPVVSPAASVVLGQQVDLVETSDAQCRSSEDTTGGGPHEDPFSCLLTANDGNGSGLSVTLVYDVRWNSPSGRCWTAVFYRISVNGQPSQVVPSSESQQQLHNGQALRGCF